jgi:hypothetical protein
MATNTSDVQIANLALQKLGASRLASLTDNSRNARSINSCYAFLRDRELEAHFWVFATTRAQLAASPVAPPFGPSAAYPLPADCLKVILPGSSGGGWYGGLDWHIENVAGVLSILTSATAPLNIKYIRRVTDPTQFPNEFVEALACKIAAHCCEEITQSNDKKQDAQAQYKQAISEARLSNAIQKPPQRSPEDSWVTARESSFDSVNWLRGVWWPD